MISKEFDVGDGPIVVWVDRNWGFLLNRNNFENHFFDLFSIFIDLRLGLQLQLLVQNHKGA